MTHVTLRAEFERLIDPYAPVGQVATGFEFTEGPIWHPVEQFLLFSDMPGDVRRRWDARRGIVEARRPSNKCNGMTYDAELNLIVCEHATSSLIRERPDGRREVLASHFENQELNSPNDVCVHSGGAIYFSDPWYGRMPVYGVERPRQLGFQGVYRAPPGDGAPRLLVDRTLFDQPNGLCFSPDERLLYVNDTVQALIRVFDVNADGGLSNARVFASAIRSELEPGLPDGMKCDQHGNVWVTAPGGVWVYSPQGHLLGKVRAPEMVANLAWGGPDFRTLYLTATHSVYAIPTKVGPRHEPYMSARAGGSATRSAPSAPQLASGDMQLDPNRCAMII
ncbi:MAG TPA: SMP-30/gluconolactonase/LRE family protein, partial [Bradyrhizobium sp.]|nr:SMP-30/gluconolactonase/LRE family protein [Bradyrhizobium sp.]